MRMVRVGLEVKSLRVVLARCFVRNSVGFSVCGSEV